MSFENKQFKPKPTLVINNDLSDTGNEGEDFPTPRTSIQREIKHENFQAPKVFVNNLVDFDEMQNKVEPQVMIRNHNESPFRNNSKLPAYETPQESSYHESNNDQGKKARYRPNLRSRSPNVREEKSTDL